MGSRLGTEVQRDPEICPRSHNMCMDDLGLDPEPMSFTNTHLCVLSWLRWTWQPPRESGLKKSRGSKELNQSHTSYPQHIINLVFHLPKKKKNFFLLRKKKIKEKALLFSFQRCQKEYIWLSHLYRKKLVKLQSEYLCKRLWWPGSVTLIYF